MTSEQTPPLAAIRELLNYNWADEERDYAEHQVNGDHDGCEEHHPGQCGHIFERMQEIRAWTLTNWPTALRAYCKCCADNECECEGAAIGYERA